MTGIVGNTLESHHEPCREPTGASHETAWLPESPTARWHWPEEQQRPQRVHLPQQPVKIKGLSSVPCPHNSTLEEPELKTERWVAQNPPCHHPTQADGLSAQTALGQREKASLKQIQNSIWLSVNNQKKTRKDETCPGPHEGTGRET